MRRSARPCPDGPLEELLASLRGGARALFNASNSVLRYPWPVTFPGWCLRACWSAPIVVTLMFCGETSARAEESKRFPDEATNPNRQRAEDLYKEGASLLSAGRYAEAEARFQESFSLLRGRGTLLNLAICHENLGRFASARDELKTLEEQALAAGDTTRLQAAREHLAWIEPQLSYLEVTLSTEAQVPGLLVELDGKPVLTFGVMFPVDAGRRQLRARAPGKKDFSVELSIQNGNQRQSVIIPSLADAAAVAAQPPAHAPPKAAVAVVKPPSEPVQKASYTGVYVAGAATLTLTVGAVVSAFLYYDRRAAYHDAISNPDSVSEAELSARRDSAEQMAWINGSLVVAAGVGALVTGIWWYRTSRANTVRVADGAWVAPMVVGSGAGLRAGASF